MMRFHNHLGHCVSGNPDTPYQDDDNAYEENGKRLGFGSCRFEAMNGPKEREHQIKMLECSLYIDVKDIHGNVIRRIVDKDVEKRLMQLREKE